MGNEPNPAARWKRTPCCAFALLPELGAPLVPFRAARQQEGLARPPREIARRIGQLEVSRPPTMLCTSSDDGSKPGAGSWAAGRRSESARPGRRPGSTSPRQSASVTRCASASTASESGAWTRIRTARGSRSANRQARLATARRRWSGRRARRCQTLRWSARYARCFRAGSLIEGVSCGERLRRFLFCRRFELPGI